MRFAGGVQLEHGKLTAVVGLAHFLGVHARAGNKLETIGQVHEQNFAVVGVNAFFHDQSLSSAGAVRDPKQPLLRETSSVLSAEKAHDYGIDAVDVVFGG
jgi:hypothetical protein